MWSVASEEIVALVVENLEAGETIALERDSEDLWRIVSPQPGPTDAARVERAVSWLASPAPRTELHDISDLTPFQLSEPSYRVEITLEDGSKLSFSVGREAPTGGSRYVSVPERPGVLVVSNLGLQEVLNLQPDLLPTPTPEPSATATEAGLPAAETPTP